MLCVNKNCETCEEILGIIKKIIYMYVLMNFLFSMLVYINSVGYCLMQDFSYIVFLTIFLYALFGHMFKSQSFKLQSFSAL